MTAIAALGNVENGIAGMTMRTDRDTTQGGPAPGTAVKTQADAPAFPSVLRVFSTSRHAIYAFVFFVIFSCLFLVRIHFNMAGEVLTQQWGIPDCSQWVWFYAWWPYAISHLINPMMSYKAWAPTGQNLGLAVSTPFTALIYAPITYLFGPIVTYNASILLAMITNACSAYLLCYEITRRFYPSVVGGWIFAYSPYVLYDMNGKPSLITLWALPMLILLSIRYAKSEISDRRFVLWSSLILTCLFYTTDEIFVTFILMSGITLLASLYLYRKTPVHNKLLRLCGRSLISVMIATALASPFIYYGLFGPGAFIGPIHKPIDFSNDLMSMVIPSPFIWLGGTALHRAFQHLNGWQLDDYLGPAVLLTMALFFLQFRKQPLGKLITIVALLALIFSFGSHLVIYGHGTSIGLPYWVLYHVPVLNKAIPARYCLYAYMAISVAVALWGSTKPYSAKWVLLALCVVTLMPKIFDGRFASTLDNPPFFAGNAYKSYIHKGENVILLPYGINGDSLVWQAEDNFYYSIAGGYFYLGGPWRGTVVSDLYSGDAGPGFYKKFMRFAGEKRVSALIVSDRYVNQCRPLLSYLHTRPLKVAGVELYNIPE